MNKAVIFGLDGATYTVLDDLMNRGIMPFLKQFAANGLKTTLRSVTPPLTPPAWTTLVTGRTPGNHGVTGFFQYDSPESNSIQIVGSRQVSAETLWSIVNRQGGRVGCLNFVAHNPAPKIDGWVVPGWTSWRWMKQLSHPANLIERLKDEIPGFDVKILAMDFEEERKAIVGANVDDFSGWVDLHIAREKQWFAVMKHLMKTDPVELVAIVFDGVDKLQHLLWPYLDPRLTPAEPTEEYLRIRKKGWSYYAAIDEILKETVEMLGEDATVLVCSDHGFTNSWEIVFINTWLEQNGYLRWLPQAQTVENPAELEPNFYRMSDFDMEHTTAYALTTSSNGIFINVKGARGPYGIEAADYQKFRDELAQRLLNEVTDPATGEKIITKCTFREDAFAGPKMQLAPDITLQLRDFGFVSVRKGDQVLVKRPVQMGTHHPDGVLLASGPGIRAGQDGGEPVQLVDIAPTTLFTMGLPIPSDLQGRVLDEIFDPAYLAANETRREGVTQAVAAGAESAAPLEDDDEIIEKMRALGYIE